MIDQLMQIERRPMILAQQRQKAIEAKRSAWQEIKKKLEDLKAKVEELRASGTAFTTGLVTSSDETALRATGAAGALPGTYNVQIEALAKAHSLRSTAFSTAAALGITGEFSLTIKAGPGQSDTKTATVQLDGTETLDQIVGKLNAAIRNEGLAISVSKLQLNADEAVLMVSANFTGADSEIVFSETTGSPLAALGLTDPANEIQAAQDARFVINGMTFTRSSNSIADAIPGASLELLKEGASATLTVQRDEAKAKAAVKEVVDQFNALVDLITSRSAWNSETKTGGPLWNDSSTSQILNTIKRAILNPVDDMPAEWSFSTAIGLGNPSFAGGGNAASLRKLHLDEEKFLEALAESPEAVTALVDRIAERLAKDLDGYVRYTGLLNEKDDRFEAELKRSQKTIEKMEMRLELRERNLRKQFEAMELALARIQSQGNQLVQMLRSIEG